MIGQQTISPDTLKIMQSIGASEIIIVLLSKLSQLLRTSMLYHGRQCNLTPVQVRTLLFVADSVAERCTLSALAHNQGITLPTAAGIVDALVHRKLVMRVPNPKDRRSVLLKLTTDGESIRREIAGWETTLRRIIESLPHDKQDALLQALREIISSLMRACDTTIDRFCYACKYFRPNVRTDEKMKHHCDLLDQPLSKLDIVLDCTHFMAS